MSVHVAWDENLARELIHERSGMEGAMLPILHALQNKFGYVDARAVAIIANSLNVSRAEVFGTISFYHDFKRQPPMGGTIKLCRAEACQARGAEELAAHLETTHGAKIDGGYHKGVSVETAYCLGNCALGPNALHDGEIYGALDPQSLDELYAAVARAAGARQ
ncbi:NAD(P)H-dependent oxidoreductase subunit E [Rhodoblastus acidophilus]|uniref:NAD(P)H-dependent oxidoreductase subunit E n=1 Tax=Candidatus Rhodoblastus alkanivorans TaxID=2954117 RepID=A0ABS9Z6I6_9HYPH|nr:NAD(P)H-dependent oxidoreductase subunit E [Candidatus Rhodoblastus alkanivorans]MCI4679699.1 NAD(P)H-dependent oxidoreductase subunit E [Candidatus Rhodoblastus alkanivorans]MCI4683239.1 NAD(P)H-dependent oxidoreductase subunit E [Candidatus Rhodoblastus alkanivorans]MDI4640551.1 NAD(P)H-dependent oxidoreductase subunit E [Rhodoblastus acidophilus]